MGNAARGWGQGVQVQGRWTWPTGCPHTGSNYMDSICDQLRHGIAWNRRSSASIAASARIEPAVIDAFMQGDDDALTFAEAARVARVVGKRLIDQRIATGLVEALDGRGFAVPTRNVLARTTSR